MCSFKIYRQGLIKLLTASSTRRCSIKEVETLESNFKLPPTTDRALPTKEQLCSLIKLVSHSKPRTSQEKIHKDLWQDQEQAATRIRWSLELRKIVYRRLKTKEKWSTKRLMDPQDRVARLTLATWCHSEAYKSTPTTSVSQRLWM